VVQKTKIYFYIIKHQKILRQLKNELDRIKITVTRHYLIHEKSANAILKISAILEKIGKFLWYILSHCTTDLDFSGLKKVEFRVGTTRLKKSRFFLKNDVIFEKSAILDFIL
jgi:hypothetical protein